MTDFDVEQLRAELERVRNQPCAQCDTRDQVADADVLAAEVRGLRELTKLFSDAHKAAELRIVDLRADNERLRAGIEQALRLYAGGHEHGDVLRAALRGESHG